jgi:hypothetical protein
MRPHPHDHITSHLQQRLFYLKAFTVGIWFAFGNALLLISGDDSIEFGFESFTSLTLNQQATPLSGNDFKGDYL